MRRLLPLALIGGSLALLLGLAVALHEIDAAVQKALG